MATIREALEQRERETLAPQAAKSADSRGRLGPDALPEAFAQAVADKGRARTMLALVATADRDPEVRCYMPGIPRAMYMPYPFLITQGRNKIQMAFEFNNATRTIHLDPVDPPPADTWMGHSVGRWEGDTLVVDVIGFNDKTWLADARDRPTPTSRGIWLHSDALHVVERWRLADADTLEYQATVEDPKMLTRPWTSPVKRVKRQPFKKIGEGMCFDTTTYELARPSVQSSRQ